MKGSRKKAKADRAALIRHRAELMLDHIGWMLPVMRAALANVADAELVAESERYTGVITDPFRSWIWNQRKLSDQSPFQQQLDAESSWNLGRIIRGELPKPEGAWLKCPHSHCIGHDGFLTFDQLRDHLLLCTQAAHAAGIAEDDPFGRVKWREPLNKPSWRWTLSDRATAIWCEGVFARLCRDVVRSVPGTQMTLVGPPA